VRVFSQSAKKTTRKETLAGVKTAGAFVSHGRISGYAWSREEALPALPTDVRVQVRLDLVMPVPDSLAKS